MAVNSGNQTEERPDDVLLRRRDVPEESTWDPSPLFASWEAWQVEYAALTAEMPNLAAYAGRLGEGPEVLADWIDLYSALRRRARRLGLYAYMPTVVDSGDVEAKGRLGQAVGLTGRFAAASAFAEPELMDLGETLLHWAEETPRLAPYRHYFADLLRQKPHRRSAEVEEILGMLVEQFSAVFQTFRDLTDRDIVFADAVDNRERTYPVRQSTPPPTGIQSGDRQRRRTAWESYCDGHRQVQNTLASNYITRVKQAVFTARVRGYDSVLAAQLGPYNVDEQVFHTLLDTFRAHLPVWHRYWDVKRRVLGLATLHPYDIWAPLVPDPPEVPYPRAVAWIAAALAPLGDDYVATLRRGCSEERWVDYAPNEEKSQGAQALPGKGTHPYLWLRYDDSLYAASILAHELGHAMHDYLAERHQPELLTEVSELVGETASNVHQAMLRAHLVAEKAGDMAFQMALIDEAMMNFHRYFFIMPTLARFELDVYTRAENDQPLTVDYFNQRMGDLFAEGYGDTLRDDRARTASTWAQFLHLYAPFYTFQYAVGISAAHAFSARILDGVSGAAEAYLDFLGAGNSVYPLDLFRQAGVDMATARPVEATFAVLEGMVERLERLGAEG